RRAGKLRPCGERRDRTNDDCFSARRVETRANRGEKRMRPAVRRAEDSDRRRIDVKPRLVGNLPDDAAQIRTFDIYVREICLSERASHPSRRIRDECESGGSDLPRVFVVGMLAAAPAVDT